MLNILFFQIYYLLKYLWYSSTVKTYIIHLAEYISYSLAAILLLLFYNPNHTWFQLFFKLRRILHSLQILVSSPGGRTALKQVTGPLILYFLKELNTTRIVKLKALIYISYLNCNINYSNIIFCKIPYY